ncbi:hypothetical protein PRIPAC_95782 [Pristionchus pacificus]|uniref:Uncharacterized protein n=1 Tax=Pristionchus pacificus TaxID=54126 RepID=A0A2A6BJD2_PRIPA|nr:hypothetical protein PRIPAC_95782 [Pristionchus pacificus]|eukprot:PDM66024.1 hypothetical protein PRIPAC_44118 [Pristionchus pacificus]
MSTYQFVNWRGEHGQYHTNGLYYWNYPEQRRDVKTDPFPVKTEEQSKPNSPAEQPPRPESVPLRDEEKPPTNNTVTASLPFRGHCICYSVEILKKDALAVKQHRLKLAREVRMKLHESICVGSTSDLPRDIFI